MSLFGSTTTASSADYADYTDDNGEIFICRAELRGRANYCARSVASGFRDSTSTVASVPTTVTSTIVAQTPPKFTTGVKLHGISNTHFDVEYDNPTEASDPIIPATNPIKLYSAMRITNKTFRLAPSVFNTATS